MAFTCNIGRKGRVLRMATGLATALAGAWLFVSGPGLLLALFALAMLAAGAFMIFEGAIGWCVVRAMGGTTPI